MNMEIVLDYIRSHAAINPFFERYVNHKDMAYFTTKISKAHFLNMFVARYEINYDINKIDLAGGRELISNLMKFDSDEINCHTFKYRNDDVSIFTDITNSIFHGFLLVKEGKVYGEDIR